MNASQRHVFWKEIWDKCTHNWFPQHIWKGSLGSRINSSKLSSSAKINNWTPQEQDEIIVEQNEKYRINTNIVLYAKKLFIKKFRYFLGVFQKKLWKCFARKKQFSLPPNSKRNYERLNYNLSYPKKTLEKSGFKFKNAFWCQMVQKSENFRKLFFF